VKIGTWSPIDEERFGVRTVKATVHTPADAAALVEECDREGAQLLIVRTPAAELPAAQALEERGCRIMDVLVYYARDVRDMPIPQDTAGVAVRRVRPDDADAVAAVARASFRGYGGHYHADPRLDRAACDEVYVSWAHRSCVSREAADEVLIADDGGAILGFLSLRRNSAEEGDGALFAVAPAARGRGIARALLLRALEWCREQGMQRMVISTQVTNVAVQKVWTRAGFEPHHALLTFHRWRGSSC
jgi:ribosomal protein S18 acetylase RimI-like enzyme